MTDWGLYSKYWDERAITQTGREAVTGLSPRDYREKNLAVLKAIAPDEVKTVIDLGCGIGLTVALVEELWPSAVYMGCDVSAEMLFRAQAAYPNKTWVKLSGPKLPENFKADLIICHSVMTHVYPDTAIEFLHSIRRTLTPGGRASISIHSDCNTGWGGDIGRIDYAPPYFERLLSIARLAVVKKIEDTQLVYAVKPWEVK